MKDMLCKSLTLGIIVLLIGVSVSSAISVDTKSTISNNQSEECRECNEISDVDLTRVESLLDRVEVYSKLLLVLSRFNSEINEYIEEISNIISSLNGFYGVLKPTLPLNKNLTSCIILYIPAYTLGLINYVIFNIKSTLPEDNLLYILVELFDFNLALAFLGVLNAAIGLNCWWLENFPFFP